MPSKCKAIRDDSDGHTLTTVQMFSILNEIKDASPVRFVATWTHQTPCVSLTRRASIVGVVGSSIGSASSVYVLVAITGYLTFGNDVNGNIVSMCRFRHTRLPEAHILTMARCAVPCHSDWTTGHRHPRHVLDPAASPPVPSIHRCCSEVAPERKPAEQQRTLQLTKWRPATSRPRRFLGASGSCH
jgi:hypothetical protein